MKSPTARLGKMTYSILRFLLLIMITVFGSLCVAATVAYLLPGSSMLVAFVGATAAILIGKFSDSRLPRP